MAMIPHCDVCGHRIDIPPVRQRMDLDGRSVLVSVIVEDDSKDQKNPTRLDVCRSCAARARKVT